MTDSISINNVNLGPSMLSEHRDRDIKYLLELDPENLLFPFRFESGVQWSVNHKMKELHGGWDSVTSHIRGTFTGHYLSSAAYLAKDGDCGMLRAKAEYIVEEIRKCQIRNGGEWAFPIPAKYLYSLRDGNPFWAPFYVCHKTMMGLLDVYRYLHNETALKIITNCKPWFLRFIRETDHATLMHMMDIEETGGIVELWADLYGVTGDPDYLELMRAMERENLFNAMLENRDVLTNLHANAMIPEIHGAAKAYEVTGEERYLTIIKNFWRQAVTERGCFATGGQTNGEIWTAKMKLANRRGETNQEHCVVFNMIRLADYLYRATGEAEYYDYIERNIVNGLLAQGFYYPRTADNLGDEIYPETGIVSYFLPMKAGAKKHWGGKTEDFWCCHCTVVQANAYFPKWIFHESPEKDALRVDLFTPASVKFSAGEKQVSLTVEDIFANDPILMANPNANDIEDRPEEERYRLTVHTDDGEPAAFALSLRVPTWVMGEMQVEVDDEVVTVNPDRTACAGQTSGLEAVVSDGYLTITRTYHDGDVLTVTLPKGLYMSALPDEPETAAFMNGADVLVGLVDDDRVLYGDPVHPETMIRPSNERLWGNWTHEYRTFKQQHGFLLKPVREIGNETYSMYFTIVKQD